MTAYQYPISQQVSRPAISIAATPDFWVNVREIAPEGSQAMEASLNQLIEAIDAHTNRETAALAALVRAQEAELDGLRRRQVERIVASSPAVEEGTLTATARVPKASAPTPAQLQELLQYARDCADMAGELVGMSPSVRMVSIASALNIRAKEMLAVFPFLADVPAHPVQALELSFLKASVDTASFQHRANRQLHEKGGRDATDPAIRSQALLGASMRLAGAIEGANTTDDLAGCGSYVGEVMVEISNICNAFGMDMADQADMALHRAEYSPAPTTKPTPQWLPF